MADVGMRSGGAALNRNRYGHWKTAFFKDRQETARNEKNLRWALRRKGLETIRHNNQQQEITAFY